MTWIDRIENTVFTIRTGDGKLFTPDWKSGETSKEFNAATFEFINLPGALINRKQVRARKFPLAFWFQGEDNIDQADDFDTSANDPRAWTVRHPFYGDITGQPISISRNDNLYNCTEVTVDFWETITTSGPVATIAPADAIAERVQSFATISPIDYSNKVSLKPADVSEVTDQTLSVNSLINKVLPAEDYVAYQQAQFAMFSAIDNLIEQPADAIATIHQVILQPGLFALSVNDRIKLIGAIYNSAVSMLTSNYTQNNKAYFESVGGISLSSLATALVNPLSADYVTRDQVTAAANNLVDMYNDYLSLLDAAYVEVGNPGSSFTASQQSQNALQDVVFQTLISLDGLAFNAKVERLVMLDRDSQLIPTCFKYMGLDPLDQNLETFRTINNIKNNSVFLIPKGTQIKYYA